MVLRHNQLRDVFVDICHKANLGVRIDTGSALTPDLSRDIKRKSRRTALLKSRNTRTIQLPLRHLKESVLE